VSAYLPYSLIRVQREVSQIQLALVGTQAVMAAKRRNYMSDIDIIAKESPPPVIRTFPITPEPGCP